MSAIGLYGAAFTSIGKNKLILKIVLVAYFTMLLFTLFYDKIILHGSQSRLIGPGNSKFYIWFYLNWRQATFDISYASVGDVAHKDVYKVPLGEAFYEDGKLDDEWYHSSMKKLSKEMEAMISKRLM
nr:conserved hypothetical protein [Babesia bovis]